MIAVYFVRDNDGAAAVVKDRDAALRTIAEWSNEPVSALHVDDDHITSSCGTVEWSLTTGFDFDAALAEAKSFLGKIAYWEHLIETLEMLSETELDKTITKALKQKFEEKSPPKGEPLTSNIIQFPS